MKDTLDAHAVRFEAVSKDLACMHELATVYHKGVIDRLLIAFRAAPKIPRRGRPKDEEKRKKRDDGDYRHSRAHDGYLAALKNGSCFFLAFIITFGKTHSKVSMVKSLLKRNSIAAKYQFSLDTNARDKFMTWAIEGNYSDNREFVGFFKGLPLLQVSRVLEIPMPTPLNDQIAQLVREKGLGTNHQVLKVIDMLFYGQAEGEEQQREAAAQTIGSREEAGAQIEAEDPKDTGILTEVGDPQNARMQKRGSGNKKEVGTQTEDEHLEDAEAQKEQQGQDVTNTDEGWWNMLRFNSAPIESLRLLRDPRFWDIVDQGVQRSKQLQIDLQNNLQRNDAETLIFALYQRKGNEDGNININLGAYEVQALRFLLGMKNGKEAYLKR